MAEPEVIEIAEPPKVEATPEPVAEPPKAAPRRSPAWLVLGGVIAAVLGFGAAQVVPQGWPVQGWMGQTTADQAGLKDAIAQVQALTAQVKELQTQIAASNGLVDRVAKLETATPPDLGQLETRLTALEARPTAQGASSDPAALAGLRADIEALKAQGAGVVSPEVQAQLDAQVKATADKLAQIEAQAKETAAAGLRQAALRQVAAALDSGAPYVRAVVDLNDLPPVIAEHAATGLPSLPALQASFPDAARSALEASLKADMGASWSDRVKNFLRAQTGARALSPQEGTDPDAVLSRAEAALAKGDVAGAMTELGGLPDSGKTAMAGWMAEAQLRLDAEAALKPLME